MERIRFATIAVFGLGTLVALAVGVMCVNSALAGAFTQRNRGLDSVAPPT